MRLPREALQAADRASALSPPDTQTLNTLGIVYTQANAHERAMALSLPFPIPNPEFPIPACSPELPAIPVLPLVDERSRAAGGDHTAAGVTDQAAHQPHTHAAG